MNKYSCAIIALSKSENKYHCFSAIIEAEYIDEAELVAFKYMNSTFSSNDWINKTFKVSKLVINKTNIHLIKTSFSENLYNGYARI